MFPAFKISWTGTKLFKGEDDKNPKMVRKHFRIVQGRKRAISYPNCLYDSKLQRWPDGSAHRNLAVPFLGTLWTAPSSVRQSTLNKEAQERLLGNLKRTSMK